MSTTPSQTIEERSTQPRDENAQSTRSPNEAEPAVELPLDQVFGILRAERRRLALQYLLTESERTTLGDLSDHIAALENDKPVEAISSKERKRVYVGLYQCHLPRMDDADVVAFDGDRKTVELGPNAGQIEPYLGVESDEATRNWAPYYLATSLLGGLLLLVHALLFPLAWLSTLLLDGLVLAYFGLSLAHARDGGMSLPGALGR